jgi:hypothetical protein
MVQRHRAREYLNPNLKYGAEASRREYLYPNLKYGAEASCKRILESKPKVWCRGLEENICIQT